MISSGERRGNKGGEGARGIGKMWMWRRGRGKGGSSTNLEGGGAGQVPQFKEHIEVLQNQLE